MWGVGVCVGGDVFFFLNLFIYFLLFYLFVVVEKKMQPCLYIALY